MINEANRVMESSKEATMPHLILIPGKARLINPNGLIDGSKHFTWVEALNFPYRLPANWQVTDGIIKLAHFLDGLRDFLGEPINITSWYRDPESNRVAGGVSNSEHLQGIAADWYVDSMSSNDLAAKIDSKVKGGLGVYPSWVHTDLGSFGRW